jgi:hypothetical protein
MSAHPEQGGHRLEGGSLFLGSLLGSASRCFTFKTTFTIISIAERFIFSF